jgi:hypothetical protein
MSEIADEVLKQIAQGKSRFFPETARRIAAEPLQSRQTIADYKGWLEEAQATCTSLGQTAENLAKQITTLTEQLKAAREEITVIGSISILAIGDTQQSRIAVGIISTRVNKYLQHEALVAKEEK